MRQLFEIIALVSLAFMVLFILLQQRSSGLGAGFGGDSTFYRSRRGSEKVLFNATIILAVAFVLSTVLSILSK